MPLVAASAAAADADLCHETLSEVSAGGDDLRNSTMALWDMPYNLQIAAKHSCLLQSLGAVTTAFLNQAPAETGQKRSRDESRFQ